MGCWVSVFMALILPETKKLNIAVIQYQKLFCCFIPVIKLCADKFHQHKQLGMFYRINIWKTYRTYSIVEWYILWIYRILWDDKTYIKFQFMQENWSLLYIHTMACCLMPCYALLHVYHVLIYKYLFLIATGCKAIHNKAKMGSLVIIQLQFGRTGVPSTGGWGLRLGGSLWRST